MQKYTLLNSFLFICIQIKILESNIIRVCDKEDQKKIYQYPLLHKKNIHQIIIENSIYSLKISENQYLYCIKISDNQKVTAILYKDVVEDRALLLKKLKNFSYANQESTSLRFTKFKTCLQEENSVLIILDKEYQKFLTNKKQANNFNVQNKQQKLKNYLQILNTTIFLLKQGLFNLNFYKNYIIQDEFKNFEIVIDLFGHVMSSSQNRKFQPKYTYSPEMNFKGDINDYSVLYYNIVNIILLEVKKNKQIPMFIKQQVQRNYYQSNLSLFENFLEEYYDQYYNDFSSIQQYNVKQNISQLKILRCKFKDLIKILFTLEIDKRAETQQILTCFESGIVSILN